MVFLMYCIYVIFDMRISYVYFLDKLFQCLGNNLWFMPYGINISSVFIAYVFHEDRRLLVFIVMKIFPSLIDNILYQSYYFGVKCVLSFIC